MICERHKSAFYSEVEEVPLEDCLRCQDMAEIATLRASLAAEKARAERLAEALIKASYELIWGKSEMYGRCPEHWQKAIDAAKAALAPPPLPAQEEKP